MALEQLVNAVAQANRQHVLAVSSTQRGCDFTKHVRCLFKPESLNFGSNHVAHGNDWNARLGKDGCKFPFARTGHAANRHDLTHGPRPSPAAQEPTSRIGDEAQFENSERPHRVSINFQSKAEARMSPMEMAIIPM